jgi:soluble lytic murein transglycosylase-like protein
MRRLLFIAPLLVAVTAHGAERGKIVITNTGNGITAYRVAGAIRQALITVRSAHEVAASPYAPLFNDAAQTHDVDPRLLVAIAGRESAMNPNAMSRVGACGLMQLMPATARILGISNIFDPQENIFGAARYLRTLLDTFHGDLDLTLAAYNAGPGAVQRYNGVPPYPETQAYVKSVRAAYERAVRLHPI